MIEQVKRATFGSGLMDGEYAKSHVLRKKMSSMDSVQIEKFRSLINKKFSADKKLMVLSIGSGEGDFDTDFIKSISAKIDRYVCIEPLKEHLGPLKSNLLKVLSERQIEIHHGTIENFYTDRKFDVVHNVHVLHWIKDPLRILKRIESYLAKGGISITVLQSKYGMPRLYSRLKTDIKGSLTAEALFQDMCKEGMKHYQLDYVPSVLDITTIVHRTRLGKSILEFIVSRKLNDQQFLQAVPFVLSLSVKRKDRTIIAEPFAFIVGNKGSANLAECADHS